MKLHASTTHPAKTAKKTWIAAAVAIQMALAPLQLAHANIDNDLTNFFNSIGGTANVTGASAFQGQTQNVATGGSLYARLPQRSYNIANVQLPGAKAGCGGIDLFAGSFSYISADQFMAMIKNIGNNALGYAFKLAIDAVDPMIGNVLDKLREASEAMNSMNINSCEAGQALVNGLAGKTSLAAQTGCASLSAYLNLSTDRAEAIGKCSDSNERRSVAAAAKADEALKNTAPLNIVSGNLMARVLEQAYPWMSDSEKRLLISLTGTMIIDNTDPADATKARIRRIPPSITSERDIVAGVQGTGGSGDTVRVPLLDCIDPDSLVCDEPTPTAIKSLKYMVDQRLTQYQALMEAGETAWTESRKAEMINFVNIATVPVLKMLKAEVSGHEIGLRSTYIDLIAAQYAIYWLDSMVRLARNAVSNYPSLGPEEADEMHNMQTDLMALQSKLKANLSEAANTAAATAELARQLADFDKLLRANNASLAQAAQLSRSLGAGRIGAASAR
jgi:conjugative transfer pilus assembly protein TraH